ncbi:MULTISPECIES: polyprenyl diphosphate synthase [Haloarcula]|uniref:Tritrans,polycis-undecaprenyl-diphosphate synthase (geranylgeranyl-diphosphate specific) n=1 Tax=Haloarcula pellucida TaxID=1427151 RepID=A0A830GPF3_9EURY|nr:MULTISPECIES: polyprenyl diphosphate synthase [Halomicroarcula]MBX0348313.1 di-trans,poly-cis-decaprenylcistransferase [Halomicroarcula pellucida]MDS0278138.1 polyprenyl diphosphate synthase [Halomicroarcula sp. S1AR25-4]GGN97963.1 UDP pyrophosphate synthase [Halomicroarcula pellucida]
MRDRVHSLGYAAYERLLRWELSGTPSHVAVIQDGNRRYARKEDVETNQGYTEGAETTESLLHWCDELDIEEVTLYAFSTENLDRPEEQRAYIFDLVEEKLRTFADADRVHDAEVCIRAIGETEMLPERVQDAIDYAEARTAQYDRLNLNVALAYGGRAELLGAARAVAEAVEAGEISSGDVDVDTVEDRLYEGPTRDVDLIVRTGGDERTSNFLPWHANGNEAATFFCTPYWPEFRKIDFLRAIRTYQNREESWRTTRARRALTLVRALENAEVEQARRVLGRFRDALPSREREALDEEYEAAD